MLYYDRIAITEGIYINKTSPSNKYNICNYWYFLGSKLMFKPCVWNGCYYLLMMFINLINLPILSIDDVVYCYAVNGISKKKPIERKKVEYYKIWNKMFSNLKMGKEISTFGKIETTKNRF